MDELKFQYFISVARHNSFSKAAQELQVVPSTVSRQISLLEEELGTKLFFRDTHQVLLTQAGQRLFDHSHSYMSQYLSINESIQNLLNVDEKRVVVSVGPYEFPLVVQAARQFQQEVPSLELRPTLNRYDLLINMVRSGSHKLFFGIRPCLDVLPQLESTSLGVHEWKVVARRDSPFWDLPREKQAMLYGQKVTKSTQGGIDPAADYLKAHGIDHTSFSVAGTFNLSCMQALLGRVAMMPEYMESWLPPELKMQQVFRDPLEVEAMLIFNRKLSNPLEVQFFEFVRDKLHR